MNVRPMVMVVRRLSLGVLIAGCGSTAPASPIEVPDAAPADAGSGGPVVDGGSIPGIDSGGPAPDAGPGDAGSLPSNTICEALYGEQVCWGTLEPATLAPGVRAIKASDGSLGVHFYCYPQDATRWNDRTLMHIVGTGDNPGATNGLLKRACALGFAGIAPMYENERDARSTCMDNTNCYGLMRREIVYGEDVAPTPIVVDVANAVLGRTGHLLDRLVAAESSFAPWATIRTRFAARSLGTFALSGHSQGSGHALLLARDFAVERLLMLGGVTDRLATGTPANSAPAWIADFAASSPKTSATRFLSYIHEDDTIATYAQVDSNYDTVGLGEACAFRANGPAYPATCRRVRTPSAGCSGFLAHLSVVLRAFGTAGNACGFPGALSPNTLTWQFLLTTPL